MSEESNNAHSEDRPETFPLDGSYESPIEQLTHFVEELMNPRIRSAYELQGFARLLLTLRRLPFTTPGIGIVLTVSRRGEQELTYYDLEIGESGFEFGYGGSVYDPAVGSDSYSNELLSVSLRRVHEGSSDSIYNWLYEAERLLKDGGWASVEDNSVENEIDWDEEVGEKYWEQYDDDY